MKSSLHDKLDDLIEEWHEGDSVDPLHVFLKMSWEEYQSYVMKSEIPKNYDRRFKNESSDDRSDNN